MVTVRRILVPTDSSDHAAAAVPFAAALAEKFGAEIVLLHVVQDLALVMPEAMMATPLPTPEVGRLVELGRESAQRFAERAGLGGRADVKTEVRVGAPAAEIVAACRELEADLVVMGTHGRTGVAHLMLGSVAERVVRLAPCPVLTVRKPE